MADPKNEQQNNKKIVYKAPWAQEENPFNIMMNENCYVKTGMAVVMGGMFGFFMGFLFNTMGPEPHLNRERSHKEQVIKHFKDVGRNGWRSAKGFSAAAGLFSATECTLEKIRGERDIYGTVLSGCFSGAALSFRGGPQAMAAGCAGFAGFSVVFDHVLEKDAKDELVRAMPTDEEAREALERQKEENAWEGSWVARQMKDNTPPELVTIEEDDDEWEYYDEDDEEEAA